MKDLLEKNNLLKPPKVGEIIEGKVIGKERQGLFLDLGQWGTGIIYGKEFQEAKNELKNLKIGDSVFAKIIDLENEEGYVELSISQASKELIWEGLTLKKEKGEAISVKISGANRGGLLTEISGIPAFLPVSQLLSEHYPRIEGGDTAKILKELQKFVGKEMEVKIFDLSQREKKLILSEKTREIEKIKEALKNYKAGDIIEGEITGITDFGAFVKFPAFAKAASFAEVAAEAEERKLSSSPFVKTREAEERKLSSSPFATAREAEERKLSSSPFATAREAESAGKEPELEGLIHISELDWKIIEDPAEVVKVGEKVKAKIIEISGEKVSLSLKALKKDPWFTLEEKYKKGNIVSGKVTKFNPFGAFVHLTPEIQGLIHISEFGTKTKMTERLKIGKKYDFQILEIRPEEHRISLKLV